MKYYAFMSKVWAVVCTVVLGAGLLCAVFGDYRSAVFAWAIGLCAFVLFALHGQLGKPKRWSGRYCE